MKCYIYECAAVWGDHFVTLAMHCLTHVPEECLKLGPLDRFSCFRFENVLGKMKMLVDSKKKPMKSLANKLRIKSSYVSKASRAFMEESTKTQLKGPIKNDYYGEKLRYPGVEASGYKTVYYNGFCLSRASVSECNSYFCTSKKKIYQLIGIVETTHDGESSINLLCKRFTKLRYAYYVTTSTYRFESDELGVFRLLRLSEDIIILDLKKVKRKCVVHTLNGQLYSYPLLPVNSTIKD